MESRRLFYRLEKRVRGLDTDTEKHRHGPLVEKLYTSYFEKERIQAILTTNVLSKSALISHANVDISTEQDSVIETLHAVRGCLPYLTAGRTLKDEIEEERNSLIEEYEQYVRSHFDTEEEYQEYVRKQSDGN